MCMLQLRTTMRIGAANGSSPSLRLATRQLRKSIALRCQLVLEARAGSLKELSVDDKGCARLRPPA